MKQYLGISLILVVMIMSSCSTVKGKEFSIAEKKMINPWEPVSSNPAVRPAWVDQIPANEGELLFVGVSSRFATEQASRNDSQEDARAQLVAYCGSFISQKSREASSTYGLSGTTLDPQIVTQMLKENATEGEVSKLLASEFYTEIFVTNESQPSYVSYALMRITKDEANKLIKDSVADAEATLRAQAEQETNAEKKMQLETAAEYFGGVLKSSLEGE